MPAFEARYVTAPHYEIVTYVGSQALVVKVSITLDEAPYSGGDALAEDIKALVGSIPGAATVNANKTTVETVVFP